VICDWLDPFIYCRKYETKKTTNSIIFIALPFLELIKFDVT